MTEKVKLSAAARADIRRGAERNCEGATVGDTLRLLSDYDALHAEAEALQRKVTELTNQRDAILLQARCWAGEAKAQQAITKAVGEAVGGVPNWGPIAAGVEALRAENGRLKRAAQTNWNEFSDSVGKADKLRTELEAARGLLRGARELIERGDFREGYCMCGSSVEGHTTGDGHAPTDAGDYYAGPIRERIDSFLTATPEPEERP